MFRGARAHAAAAVAAPWGWNGAACDCRCAIHPHLLAVGAGNRDDPGPAWHGKRANGDRAVWRRRDAGGKTLATCCCRPRPRDTAALPKL